MQETEKVQFKIRMVIGPPFFSNPKFTQILKGFKIGSMVHDHVFVVWLLLASACGSRTSAILKAQIEKFNKNQNPLHGSWQNRTSLSKEVFFRVNQPKTYYPYYRSIERDLKCS